MSESKPQTIGLYGGSFNPPHVAHVLAVGWALASGGVDEVWVIPTGGHPFGKPLAPFADRLAMCRLAFSCFGARVRVLDVEREPRVHYSVDTVSALARENPDKRFRWLIGSDAMAQSGEWKDFDRLSQIAPPLVIGREGHGAGAAFTLPDISSTMIRDRLARKAGGPAPDGTLETLLPGPVLDHIRSRGLYETPGPGS